jgi:hypothetical protein
VEDANGDPELTVRGSFPLQFSSRRDGYVLPYLRANQQRIPGEGYVAFAKHTAIIFLICIRLLGFSRDKVAACVVG